MRQKIKNPDTYEICEFDSVDAATVYIGSFSDLRKANLKWREDKEAGEMCGVPYHVLTLTEIRDQICGSGRDCHHEMITIFLEEPLRGSILQYGNYGDQWWEIGETMGYA